MKKPHMIGMGMGVKYGICLPYQLCHLSLAEIIGFAPREIAAKVQKYPTTTRGDLYDGTTYLPSSSMHGDLHLFPRITTLS